VQPHTLPPHQMTPLGKFNLILKITE